MGGGGWEEESKLPPSSSGAASGALIGWVVVAVEGMVLGVLPTPRTMIY
jgi:hypothetical protein